MLNGFHNLAETTSTLIKKFSIVFFPEFKLYFHITRWTKSYKQRVNRNEQQAKSNEERTKSNGEGGKSNEQQAESN